MLLSSFIRLKQGEKMVQIAAWLLVRGDVVSRFTEEPIDFVVASVAPTKSGKSIKIVFTNGDVAYTKPNNIVRVDRMQKSVRDS